MATSTASPAFSVHATVLALAAIVFPDPLDFAAPRTVPAAASGTDMVAGHFNGDGLLDVAVTDAGRESVGSLLGDGRGGFVPGGPPFATSGIPEAIVAADFDGDGIEDLVVAEEEGLRLGVYLGGGTGTFGFGSSAPLGSAATDLDVGDFDHDGTPDVVWIGQSSGRVALCRGDGTGRLGAPESYDTRSYLYRLLVADLDVDGNLDLAVAASPEIQVWRGDELGRLSQARAIPLSGHARGFAIADFDADGVPDHLLSAYLSTDADLELLLGDGSGGVRERRTISVGGGGAETIHASDLDRDGHVDAVAKIGYPKEVVPLFGDGGGRLVPGAEFFAGPGPESFATTDTDGDGIVDVVSLAGGFVWTTLGDGRRGFAAWPPEFATDPAAVSGVAGDIDGDGTVEIVTAGGGARGISVQRCGGAGELSRLSFSDTPAASTRPVLADVNGDGFLDAAVTHRYFAGSLSILRGDAEGRLRTVWNQDVGETPIGLAPGDFDEDGNVDLAVVTWSAPGVTIFAGDGWMIFDPIESLDVGEHAVSITAGDFDADGHLDLATANSFADRLAVVRRDDTGRFAAAEFIPVGGRPTAIDSADFDGDGLEDLVFVRFDAGSIGLATTDGAVVRTFETPWRPRSIAVADLDRDDSVDVAVGQYFAPCVTALRSVGPLALGSERSFGARGDFTQVVAGDVNADGFSDLIGLGPSLSVFANLGADCGRGNVNSGRGSVREILTVNGSAGGPKRSVVAAPRTETIVEIAEPPAGPSRGRYVLWAWSGWSVRPAGIAWGGRVVGCAVNPTPLARPAAPQPLACLGGDGLPPALVAGVRRIATSPPFAPFRLRRAGGFPRRTVLTLQAIVEDEGASSASGFSTSNAVTLVVR